MGTAAKSFTSRKRREKWGTPGPRWASKIYAGNFDQRWHRIFVGLNSVWVFAGAEVSRSGRSKNGEREYWGDERGSDFSGAGVIDTATGCDQGRYGGVAGFGHLFHEHLGNGPRRKMVWGRIAGSAEPGVCGGIGGGDGTYFSGMAEISRRQGSGDGAGVVLAADAEGDPSGVGYFCCGVGGVPLGRSGVDCRNRFPSLFCVVDGRKTKAGAAAGGGIFADYCEAPHEHRADVAGNGAQIPAAPDETGLLIRSA